MLAPRGKILDRDGRVIVDNHSSFSLFLSRENLKMEHLQPIAEGLNLDYDDLVARVRRFQSRGAPQYEPILIKEELTPGELAFVESHKDRRHVSGTRSDPRAAAPVSARWAWPRTSSDTSVR